MIERGLLIFLKKSSDICFIRKIFGNDVENIYLLRIFDYILFNYYVYKEI